MVGVRQIVVAVGFAAKGDEKAVREAVRLALDADIRPLLKILYAVYLGR